MLLSDSLLTDEEIKLIDRVSLEISRHNEVKKHIKKCFSSYLKNSFPDSPLNRNDKSRMFVKPSKLKYQKVPYFYDYIMTQLHNDLSSSITKGVQLNDIHELLNKLRGFDRKRRSRLKFKSDEVPIAEGFDEFIRDEDIESNVPNTFIDKFFGYRPGGKLGEIIRFYMHIALGSSKGYVNFLNEYARENSRWIIKGNGLYMQETLYMFGIARNADQSMDRNLGMRFIALKEISETKLISGVLISMDDQKQPIASRILLVPINDHDFQSEYRDRRGNLMLETIIKSAEFFDVSKINIELKK